jgi:Tfp pilus assembly protein PilP
MKQHPLILTALAFAVLSLSACGGGDDTKAGASATPAPAGKAAARAPAKKAPVQELPQVVIVPENYRYEVRQRRDPFVNPTPKPVPTEEAKAAVLPRPEGLRGIAVAEARVTGIVASRESGMTKAMLTAGRTTHFVTRGDVLWDAVIKDIRPDAVVFTMVSPTTRQPINRETIVRAGDSGGSSAGEKK